MQGFRIVGLGSMRLGDLCSRVIAKALNKTCHVRGKVKHTWPRPETGSALSMALSPDPLKDPKNWSLLIIPWVYIGVFDFVGSFRGSGKKIKSFNGG